MNDFQELDHRELEQVEGGGAVLIIAGMAAAAGLLAGYYYGKPVGYVAGATSDECKKPQ